jgi:hypothetical protein
MFLSHYNREQKQGNNANNLKVYIMKSLKLKTLKSSVNFYKACNKSSLQISLSSSIKDIATAKAGSTRQALAIFDKRVIVKLLNK